LTELSSPPIMLSVMPATLEDMNAEDLIPMRDVYSFGGHPDRIN